MGTAIVRFALWAAITMVGALHPSAFAGANTGEALREIYNTFGNRDDRYLGGDDWIVATMKSDNQFTQWAAIAFSVEVELTLRKIQLGLSHHSGKNAIVFTLRGDRAGVPGEILREFAIKDLEAYPHCCEVKQVSIEGGMLLKAGVTYWLVAEAHHDTYAGWNVNSIEAFGMMAFTHRDGTGWHRSEFSGLPAVRLLAD